MTCSFFYNTLLKVDTSHYDLSVLSTSVMGLKSLDIGWISSIPFFGDLFYFFNFANPLINIQQNIKKQQLINTLWKQWLFTR